MERHVDDAEQRSPHHEPADHHDEHLDDGEAGLGPVRASQHVPEAEDEVSGTVTEFRPVKLEFAWFDTVASWLL